MLYLTDFSTASKMLNLNNPIQETVRFRSVGSGITLLLSVPKGRDICECGKNQSYVILERKYLYRADVYFNVTNKS